MDERCSPAADDEIDAFGVSCADLKRCLLLPISHLEGGTYVHLRLTPARNNRRIGANLADDPDLAKMVRDLGAIAQLGERLHGMQEVAGSSPASST